jgi:DNA-binding CsgD family transcriptional regulator
MRVVLTGRPNDRDRVRPQLLEAGIEIVGESDAAPGVPSAAQSVDAIVIATDVNGGVSHGPRARSGAMGPPRVSASGGYGGDEVPPFENEPLTTREHEVLALLAEGLPNKAIAHALGISDQTVKFHVAAIIGKLGASNRTDAVRRAIRRGLVAV